MSAAAFRWGRWRRPTITITRLTVGIVVALFILLASLLAAHGAWPLPAYGVLVLVTAAVLRSVSREPGSWLGRRAVRRALVAALVGDCVGILVGTALPAFAPGAVLVVLMVLLDVPLGRATQRLATAPDQVVDERQEALRNHAHRLAYLILAVAFGGTLLVADVATPQSRLWLENAVPFGYGLLVFFQLLFVLPAMTLAWLEPDRIAPEDRMPVSDRRAPLALVLLTLTAATPFLLSLGPVILPVRTTSWMSSPRTAAELGLANGTGTCREFTASADVGIWVEAKIPLHAVACWNGRQAFESWGLNQSDCHILLSSLATMSTERCVRTTDADGTLHFIYGARVRPQFLPFLSRELTVALVLDRDGRVERFP